GVDGGRSRLAVRSDGCGDAGRELVARIGGGVGELLPQGGRQGGKDDRSPAGGPIRSASVLRRSEPPFVAYPSDPVRPATSRYRHPVSSLGERPVEGWSVTWPAVAQRRSVGLRRGRGGPPVLDGPASGPRDPVRTRTADRVHGRIGWIGRVDRRRAGRPRLRWGPDGLLDRRARAGGGSK